MLLPPGGDFAAPPGGFHLTRLPPSLGEQKSAGRFPREETIGFEANLRSMTETRSHEAKNGKRSSRISPPLSVLPRRDGRSAESWVRSRRFWLALGGVMLLALAGGWGGRHWHAASPAAGPAVKAPPEAAAELRPRQAAAARPNAPAA